MKLKVLLVLSPLLMPACAPPIPPTEMKPLSESYIKIATNKHLERKVDVGSITIDKEASMYGVVTAESYKEAFQSSLLTANYLSRADDTSKYLIDVRMTELDVPAFGLNFDCYVSSTYNMRDKKTGDLISTDSVKSHYLAKFGESFDGGIRARLCIAKSIRENITHYLRLLSTKTSKDLK